LTASIPVDLLNPGQVFACLGFLEAADVLCGPSLGGFDWAEPGAARFVVRSAAVEDPIREVLAFLETATLLSLAPAGSGLTTADWGVDTRTVEIGSPFPVPQPKSPAPLPATLTRADRQLTVDHWADGTRRDNVKFWAGAAGYPGVGLLRDALALVPRPFPSHAADPFAVSAIMSSSFRFDWRRDYIPIDIGFSLNAHGAMTPRGFPLVEVLAAIGMSHARPARVDPRDKLAYRYAVLSARPGLLPPVLHRAALGGADDLPFPSRTFRMNLSWPGQEGQARCITTVAEEHRP
jgi:CRISPR-associated protein Csx14